MYPKQIATVLLWIRNLTSWITHSNTCCKKLILLIINKNNMTKLSFQTCVNAIRKFDFRFDRIKHKRSVLSFKRDTSNPYDSNCINVYLDNIQIGYIKASEARYLAPRMDRLPKDCKVQRWDIIKATPGYLVVNAVMS